VAVITQNRLWQNHPHGTGVSHCWMPAPTPRLTVGVLDLGSRGFTCWMPIRSISSRLGNAVDAPAKSGVNKRDIIKGVQRLAAILTAWGEPMANGGLIFIMSGCNSVSGAALKKEETALVFRFKVSTML